jgi:hypothetical protein
MGKLQVFIAPLLDKSACHRAHDAQEEAEKQYDIDANGDTWGTTSGLLTISTGREESLVYFDDE